MKKFLLFLSAFSCMHVLATTADAEEMTLVPPGNRRVEQPPVPGASAKRTKALKSSYEAKYQKVFTLLRNDRELRARIDSVAAEYGIHPLHIAGAIVGEHTYNVDAYDRLQTYYVKAVSYLGNRFGFSYRGEDLADFLARPEFGVCARAADSYELWTCRESVWNASFRGKSINGHSYPNDRFSAVFFQPLYAGQTFGIGQLNPLTALEMSDLVHEVSGLPKLDYRNPQQVYQTIMDPDLTLPYVAATLRKAMDSYRDIAGFDISENPGVTATLYNVGNPQERAYALKLENDERRRHGLQPRLPEENYYGWLINDKRAELETLF